MAVKRRIAAFTLLAPLLAAGQLPAQESTAVPAELQVAPASQPANPVADPHPPSETSEAKPAGEAQAEEARTKQQKEQPKEPARPEVITRPEASEGTQADLTALRQQVDNEGLVRFSLEGVPWPDLLRWLAEASSLSLDWQELPADALNLRTQRAYSIEEARDVINRHLLARGFTMLQHGELLSVARIEKLNPGLVPRVAPERLEERMAHEFVKVSFTLDWLMAEKAVEELKPMLSPNGKLTALSSTNRLEAIDAVVNLREIWNVLLEEQAGDGDNRVVEVFHLTHVSAAEAVALVEQILGLKTQRSAPGALEPNAGQQIMQQLQQLQQNLQQQAAGGAKPGGANAAEPRLIVNERDNSIVAHAPPDKMEIIRQTVTALDTPSSHRGRAMHMKVFRLSTLDPVPLVATIRELADLSPGTRVQADGTNNSLIVHGTLVDLNSVWELVKELDGSTRNFEVIPLRRLAAEEVAGTIQYLMGSEDEEKDSQNAGYFSYYSYRYGSNGNSQKEEKRPFKVDADIENNRLLLWANEVELEEVQNLLVKMGEIPAGERNNETLRILDLSSDEDADAVLQRLRQMWPHLAPNKLEIQPPAHRQTPAPDVEAAPPSEVPPSDELPTFSDRRARTGPRGTTPRTAGRAFAGPSDSHPLLDASARTRAVDVPLPVSLTQPAVDPEPVADIIDSPVELASEADLERDRLHETPTHSARSAEAETAAPASAPPILIQRGPDGKLIISSPDTRALNHFEDVVADVAPPRKDYHIFHLKYPNTWAYGIELTLREIFKSEMEGTPTLDWWGGIINQRKSGPSRLSKRRELKIISDSDSRTILVQGATPVQLATIGRLIEIYDQPRSSDPQAMRTTRFFQLKHSSAQVVAATLKDVYRDLLSTNDPALQTPNGDKNDRPQNTGTTLTYVYNRGGSEEGDEKGEEPSRITFKGLLSVGVDQTSNTLVVSAIEGLMPEITEIIDTLDQAAQPAGNFRVIPLDPRINPAAVQARLQKLLESKRPQAPNGQQNPQQPGQPNAVPNPAGNGPQVGFSPN